MSETKQKTILLVEDDAIHVKILRNRLTDEGFKFISAADGEKGLAYALHDHPDLILLDRVMPVMDGITMLKKLRESGDWGKNVSIILLTNLSADDEFKNFLATTGDKLTDYIVKADWTLSEIVEKVKEKLSA